ncbi:MAG: hypothetical protein A2381_14310 [Bdellovibrionales bacterium RIFOXYB1_FULL_37_110]|nr:MAG: hypothetical protein A2417_07080 [Bdellovibrionales bacterium RIFOXYC1_FULL_37_79]OFZ57516.1 MAG: hypothetical protein A2381_14310 [Bdellovibrionales bacterium RIFOXYB1_FULL_37_110]OFZ62987.1 MAG: hypothetical protein A2577_07590 [Bdellovibrionales bacterium RIFOXYD1_FULL_36_51]
MKKVFTLLFLVLTCVGLAIASTHDMSGVYYQVKDDMNTLCPDYLEIIEIVCDEEGENGQKGVLLRQIRSDAWGNMYPQEVVEKSDVRFCQINGDKIKRKYKNGGNFWGQSNMDYVDQAWLISSDEKINLQKITKWIERSYLMKISSGMEVIKLNFQKNNMSQIVKVQLSMQGIWYDLTGDGRDYIRTMDCTFQRP